MACGNAVTVSALRLPFTEIIAPNGFNLHYNSIYMHTHDLSWFIPPQVNGFFFLFLLNHHSCLLLIFSTIQVLLHSATDIQGDCSPNTLGSEVFRNVCCSKWCRNDPKAFLRDRTRWTVVLLSAMLICSWCAGSRTWLNKIYYGQVEQIVSCNSSLKRHSHEKIMISIIGSICLLSVTWGCLCYLLWSTCSSVCHSCFSSSFQELYETWAYICKWSSVNECNASYVLFAKW